MQPSHTSPVLVGEYAGHTGRELLRRVATVLSYAAVNTQSNGQSQPLVEEASRMSQ